MLQDNESHQ